MARIDAGRMRAHRYIALTCKTGLVSRIMSYKVHIVVKKHYTRDSKTFLLYIIRFNVAIQYTLLIISQL